MLVSLPPKAYTQVRLRLYYNKLKFLMLALLLASAASATAQQAPDQKPDQKTEKKKPAYVLTVKTRPILNLSLKAEKESYSAVLPNATNRPLWRPWASQWLISSSMHQVLTDTNLFQGL